MNYIRTYSGKKFFTTPTPDQVDLLDIAIALSRAPRFVGQSYRKYAVAAHAIHVSLLVPKQLRLQAIFHDASEAYLADIPSPFKSLMPDYKRLEAGIMDAIAKKFGFAWPKSHQVDHADSAVLYLEREALFLPSQGMDDEVIPYVKPPVEVKWDFHRWSLMSSKELANEFFNRAQRLLKNEH